MFNTAEMRELASRKRLLLMESELHRHALRVEFRHVEEAAANLERYVRIGMKVYPVALGAFSVARGLLARRKRRSRGLMAKALLGWRLVRLGLPIWKRFRS